MVTFLMLGAVSFFLQGRHALENVQEIHKAVGTSLLSIRKNFPGSQQQVYTTIDQVSKLCDISKKQHTKRKSFKEALQKEKQKNEELFEKAHRVAQKLIEVQKQVAEKDQKIMQLLQQQSVAITSAHVVPSPSSPIVDNTLMHENEQLLRKENDVLEGVNQKNMPQEQIEKS